MLLQSYADDGLQVGRTVGTVFDGLRVGSTKCDTIDGLRVRTAVEVVIV